MFEYFTSTTPNAEKGEYTFGIKNFGENYFGFPPNKDNSGVINILVLDIRDSFEGSGNYIAGYFDRNDQSNSSTSNQMDILYIDCNPVDMISDFPEEALFTLAHEFEHLLHYNSDPNEIIDSDGNYNPWLDEGIADLFPSILGLGVRDYGHYLSNTKIGIDEWIGNGLAYYSKSALFVRYLYEIDINGLSIIQDIFNDSDLSRLESVKNKLENYNFLNFNNFFNDWVINTINNQYLLSDCIPDVSPNITVDNNTSNLLEILGMPDYSFYNILIPSGLKKNYIVNLDNRDQVYINNYNNKNIIEEYEEGYWSFSDSSTFYDYLYSYIHYESLDNNNNFELDIGNASNLNTFQYDNNQIDMYLSMNENRWYAGIVFDLDTTALLTSIDFMLANDTAANIKINKGGFNYVPQLDTTICSTTSSGWNRINISKSQIFINDENVFVMIEVNENAVGISDFIGNQTNSYFSLYGDSYTNLSEYYAGNWAIRLSYIDTNFVEMTPEENELYIYPNPYNPILDLNLNTFIYTENNEKYFIDVYDINGRKIKNLHNEYPQIDVLKNVKWDGTDYNGMVVSSGTYVLRHFSKDINKSYFITVLK